MNVAKEKNQKKVAKLAKEIPGAVRSFVESNVYKANKAVLSDQ